MGMAPSMPADILVAASMDMALFPGPMAPSTMVSFWRMTSMELVLILGAMGADTRASGQRIRWTAEESLKVLMAECTRGSIKAIRSTVMEVSLGQMDVGMKANGRWGNSTAPARSPRSQAKNVLVHGLRASRRD